MKHLLTINQGNIQPGYVTPKVTPHYHERLAARAVVIDNHHRVYLLSVGAYQSHKLPGGGIQKEEPVVTALKREIKEELGCNSEIITEIGTIVEYIDAEKIKQTSYCFLARISGVKGQIQLDDEEKLNNLQTIVAKDIDDAINIIENDTPNTIMGSFIQLRDSTILKAAAKVINESTSTTTEGTVCFFVSKNRVMLAKITYPDGRSLWNGIGGVIDSNETPTKAAVREINEETELIVEEADLTETTMVTINTMLLHVFVVKRWNGDFCAKDPSIKEFKWFDFDQVPYENMHTNNDLWLPSILAQVKKN